MAKLNMMGLMSELKQLTPVITDTSWWDIAKYGASTMDTGLLINLSARKVS